ncbi:unnamed protein product [Rotaria sordida]|uniref:Uncharacterized protein n=1 Tax=Rotaria sordida TaxID=392033 RepID=A0A814X9L6_9BILA|nr:unnamed protein product [Rotaria sordida]CAF1320963.1 unnamed protein product [Rotaria sordida]CAF3567104.1 unnamed protein product [Rotaria sordida]CAF3674102.1 unnamed protein product [Rotaria sordida]
MVVLSSQSTLVLRRIIRSKRRTIEDRWWWCMTVRNTLCKRTIIAYCMFFFTVLLIWKYHEKSIKIEEEEDTLKQLISSTRVTTTIHHKTTIIQENEKQTILTTPVELNRLDYWLKNNSRTFGINLTAILAPKRPGKYLVYVCHENCGGWGDRLRGIMSLFMLSLMLDRNFRIEITHPCNLTHILRPNLYNWTQSIDGLVVVDPITHRRRFNLTRKMLITTANARKEVLTNVSQILYNNRSIDSIWSEDVLYWATNKDYFYQLSNNIFYRKKFKSYGIMTKYNIKLEILFSLFYEILFRPVNKIQQHILQYKLKHKNNHIICAQIRTGKNPTIPHDKVLPGRQNISEMIFSFIDSNNSNINSQIFLTTDNEQVYHEARQRYGSRLLYVPGEITHLDRSLNIGQKVCREQDKLLTDFHLLGELCDISIISNSGFGFWGNLRRYKPFEQLFVFCAGRIYKIESMWHLYKMREQNHYGELC